MSTVYRGKLSFTTNELKSYYDNVSFSKFYSGFKSNFGNFSDKNKSLQLPKPNVTEETESSDQLQNLLDYLEGADNDFTDNDYFPESNESTKTCKYCHGNIENIVEISTDIRMLKNGVLNVVFNAMLYGLKDFQPFIDSFLQMNQYDNEFVWKMALFCRKELNIRTVANFLMSLGIYLEHSRQYTKKYLIATLSLPNDWLEVICYYMKLAKSQSLPSSFRKVLLEKFKQFNTYQIGKYQSKEMEVDLESKKIKLNLKNLIRILHICDPVDHVMGILGKRYPETREDFRLSKLPGDWDENKKGKRMRIPIPETWETQISKFGNKAEVWEKLIENKSLPYMAMIRNLRNMLQANLKQKYHDKVISLISNEASVIKGKLMPFHYFVAFQVLSNYNEDIAKAKEQFNAAAAFEKKRRPATHLRVQKGIKKFSTKGKDFKRINDNKMNKLKRTMEKPVIDDELVKKYTNSLNKAVELSCLHNIPRIRGRILVLANMDNDTYYPKFKYQSNKMIKDVIALLTAMCIYAAEYCEVYLVRSNRIVPYAIDRQVPSIMAMTNGILNTYSSKNVRYHQFFEEVVLKHQHFDSIILFDVIIRNELLAKYVEAVNPDVRIYLNRFSDDVIEKINCKNVFELTGFNEHSLRIISEHSCGGLIEKINLMDQKYDLQNSAGPVTLVNRPINNALSERKHEINIFVSSTFLDMVKERDIINKIVFPTLKKEITSEFDFMNINCIDLRWGIPKHLSESEQLLKYCVEQVKRSDILIGMIGERSGWVPPEGIIDSIRQTYPELADNYGLSITNIEYECAPPHCKKLFVLRQSNDPNLVIDYNLEQFRSKVRSKEFCLQYTPDTVHDVFKQLYVELKNTVISLIDVDGSRDYVCESHSRYDRMDVISAKQIEFVNYSIKDVTCKPKTEIKSIIEILNSHLPNKVRLFYDAMSKNTGTKSNKTFATSKLDNIKHFGGILALEGTRGCGKTFLTSMLLDELKSALSGNRSGPEEVFFMWSIDYIKTVMDTNQQLSLFDLLYDLIEFILDHVSADFKTQLKKHTPNLCDVANEDFWRPIDLKSALIVWHSILSLMHGCQFRITFIIDGLESLYDATEACSLNWIPFAIPRSVRLILITTSASQLAKSCKSRGDCFIYEIKPIAISVKRKVIEGILNKQGKSLDSVPFNDYLLDFTLKRDSNKPLYLKLAINHLILYGTFDKISETVKALPSTIDQLLMHTLKAIENEVGKKINLTFFSFLIVSRIGLTIDDIQHLMGLYFKTTVFTRHRLEKPVKFPIYPLLLIKSLSSSLLVEDQDGNLSCKDKFIKAIVTQYTASVNKQPIFSLLASYCDDLMLKGNKPGFQNVIFYKFRATLFEQCHSLLTNVTFLRNRFDWGIADGLLDDYAGYEDNVDSNSSKWADISSKKDFLDFRNFISEHFSLFKSNPDLFLQHCVNADPDSAVKQASQHLHISPCTFSNDKRILFNVIRTVGDSYSQSTAHCSTAYRVCCCIVNGPSKLAILGFDTGLVQSFCLNTFKVLNNYRKHTQKVTSLSFLESEEYFVSCGTDRKAVVWHTEDGTIKAELNDHEDVVTGCVYSTKTKILCTSGLDGQCILWSRDRFQSSHVFKLKSPINCIAIHPVNDGKIILGLWNGNMVIYNLVDFKRIAVLHHSNSVHSIAFHPRYNLFVICDVVGTISLWNSFKGIKIKDMSDVYQPVPSLLSYSNNGISFYQYSNMQSEVSVWCPSLGYIQSQHDLESVSCVDSNTEFLVFGNQYGLITVFNHSTSRTVSIYLCDRKLTAVSIKKQSRSAIRHFVAMDYNCTLYLCYFDNLRIQVQATVEAVHSRPVNVLLYFRDYIVSGSDDCSVFIFKTTDNDVPSFESEIYNVFIGPVLTMEIYDDELLIGSKDKSLGLFNLQNQTLLHHELNAHDDWITALSFVTGSKFLTGSADCSIKIWTIERPSSGTDNDELYSFKVLCRMRDHTGFITSLTVKSENMFGTASADGTIKLWNSDGLLLDNIELNVELAESDQNHASWIKFHQTDSPLLCLDKRNRLYLFDVDNCLPVNKLKGHSDVVTCLADGGDYLVTGSFDKSIKLWNYADVLRQTSCCPSAYYITNSVFMETVNGTPDVLATYINSGCLLFWSFDVSDKCWKIIDSVDVKAFFQKNAVQESFPLFYLECECLNLENSNTLVLYLINNVIKYDVNKKSFSTGVRKEMTDSINEFPDTLVHTSDIKLYYLKINVEGRALELWARPNGSDNLCTDEAACSRTTKVTAISLQGEVVNFTHFRNQHGESVVFLSFRNGNVEFIDLKSYSI